MENTTAQTGTSAVSCCNAHKTRGWRVSGKNRMELVDVELPAELADGMVELKLLKCGICGSDLNYLHKGDQCILGHEATARVVRVANDVTRLKAGDLVAVEPALPCGECVECEDGRYHTCRKTRYMATPPQDGCLSHLFQWPARWCHRLPEVLQNNLRVATLAEPLAACLQAISLRKRTVPYRQGKREFEAVLGGGSMAMGVIAIRQAQSVDNRLISAARSMADINFAIKLFRVSDPSGHVVVVLEAGSAERLAPEYRNAEGVHVYTRGEDMDVQALRGLVVDTEADIVIQLSNADDAKTAKNDNVKIFQLARELAGHRISAAYECTGSEMILESAIESRFLRGEGAMIGLGCHYGIQFDKASLRRDEVALVPVRRSKDKFPTVLDLLARNVALFELLVGSTLKFEETPSMGEKGSGTPTGSGGPKVLIELE